MTSAAAIMTPDHARRIIRHALISKGLHPVLVEQPELDKLVEALITKHEAGQSAPLTLRLLEQFSQ